MTRQQVVKLGTASDEPLAYPYERQRRFTERNLPLTVLEEERLATATASEILGLGAGPEGARRVIRDFILRRTRLLLTLRRDEAG